MGRDEMLHGALVMILLVHCDQVNLVAEGIKLTLGGIILGIGVLAMACGGTRRG